MKNISLLPFFRLKCDLVIGVRPTNWPNIFLFFWRTAEDRKDKRTEQYMVWKSDILIKFQSECFYFSKFPSTLPGLTTGEGDGDVSAYWVVLWRCAGRGTVLLSSVDISHHVTTFTTTQAHLSLTTNCI